MGQPPLRAAKSKRLSKSSRTLWAKAPLAIQSPFENHQPSSEKRSDNDRLSPIQTPPFNDTNQMQKARKVMEIKFEAAQPDIG